MPVIYIAEKPLINYYQRLSCFHILGLQLLQSHYSGTSTLMISVMASDLIFNK
jgi:hypothetical protein